MEKFGDHPQAILFLLTDWDQDVAFLTLELGFYQMCDSGKSLLREESGETRGKG